jgi:hypothetical protein
MEEKDVIDYVYYSFFFLIRDNTIKKTMGEINMGE